MEMKPYDRKTLLRTMIVTGVIVLIVVPVLFYSLYKIQIRDAETLQSKAIAQQTRDMLVSPVRGAIYDRNMTALALSATVETIVISPAEIKDEAEAEFTARGLAEILDMDYEAILKKTTNKKSYYEIVARKVDKEVSDAVREFKTENKLAGIKLFEDTKRYYPYSTLLSNVIGFTNYDNEGQYGLEMKYEEVLKGVVGRVITAKDRDGNAMSFYFEQYHDAQDGMSLVLTVDYGVQEILEKHLEVALAENGCDEGVLGIVMNPKTGEILAMAQKGDYDLNNPRTVNDEEILNSILAAPEDERSELMLEAMMEQWRNKAIQEPYEPGSVFKIITASIALEENVVNANSTFFCSGTWKIGSKTTGHCWRLAGHGSQSFAKALQNSCNCAFVNIALDIGAEKYYEYFKAFGLTEKTGVDMMGEVGVVEGVHYHPYSVFSNPLYGGDVSLGMYGFGQTFAVTPIQMITAVSAVVNGGYLMKPYVVSGIADGNGNIVEQYAPTAVRQVISEETSAKMRTLVESVVSQGTGSNAYVRGYRVGGKTGTSEKRAKSIAEGKDFYIASFLGVAPCDDPQVAVLVLLDEPTGYLHQGGQIAAPVVGRIMNDLMPYLGVKAVYTDEELANLSIEVPLVVGGEKSWAQSVVKNAKLNVKVVGDGDKVTSQYPASGAKIPSTATVILYCGAEPDKSQVKIPDLTGKTYEQAVRLIEEAGLYMEVGGSIGSDTDEELTVMHQSPAAVDDATVQFGSVITVEFYKKSNTGE